MSNIETMKKIDQYIRGELKDSEIDELWIEFLKNPELYDLFETELLLRDRGKKTEAEAVLSNPGNSFFEMYKKQLFAIAAILTLSFGIFMITIIKQSDVRNFAIESIHQDEILGADNFRSHEENSVDTDLMLNMGLEAALENRINDAVSHFNSVLKNDPDPAQKMKAQYNLGILHYNRGEFQSSIDSFEIIDMNLVEQEYLQEKIMWFLGNAMLQNSQLNGSEEVLQRVIGMNGNYLEEATLLQQKLQKEIQSRQY